MTSLNEKGNKNRHILLWSVFMSTAFLFIMILMGPTQDTGDDAFIAWQLSRGAGSIASFISPYLSLLISTLYDYFPIVAWWSVLPAISAWLLLVTVIYIVIRQYDCPLIYLLLPILFAAVWISVLKKINFTRTATAFSIAGAVLVMDSVFAQKRINICNIIRFLFGLMLIVFGSMVRLQAALLIYPFLMIYIFFYIKKRCCKGYFEKNIIGKLGIIIIPIVVSVLLSFMNSLYWNIKPEWKEYNYYNSVRSAIADYVEFYPTWEQGEIQYKKIGLKEANDLDLLFDIVFLGDTNIFDLNTLEEIKTLKKNDIKIKDLLNSMLMRIKLMIFEGKVLFWFFLLLIVIYFYLGKKALIYSLIHFICAFFILVVFSFLGRMMLRVWEPILLCTIVMIIISFDSSNKYERYNKLSLLSKSISFCFLALLTFKLVAITQVSGDLANMHIPKYTDDRDDINRSRAEYINATPERIYLLTQPLMHHPPNPGFFGVWEPLPKQYCKNYFALSNWDACTPTNLKALKELGITNPVKALIDRSDVYSDYDERIFKFIKSHYGKNITCSIIDTFDDSGAIVQYTKPILDSEIQGQYNEDIIINNSEQQSLNNQNVWHINGKIRGTDSKDYTELYCNIRIEGQLYTYRLSYDSKDSFFSYFCDFNEDLKNGVEEIYFVGKTGDGKYINLGNVPLFIENKIIIN